MSDPFTIPPLPLRTAPPHATSNAHAKAAGSASVGSREWKDQSVQGTSDDAAVSKACCVSLGYFEDPFLEPFLAHQQRARRPPLINRGYWTRAAAINQILDEFTKAGEEEPAVTGPEQATAASSATATATVTDGASSATIHPSSPFYRPAAASRPPAPFSPAPAARVRKQVVSLGAGSDTNYFKLKAAGRAPFRYIEVDFPVAMAKKAHIIRYTPSLLQLVSQANPQLTEEEARAVQTRARDQTPEPALDLPSADYALVGADMRDLAALEAGLRRAQVDFSLPTLILSECVLIYMLPGDSGNLLRWLTDRFIGGAAIWTYEQILPFDAFGTTMRENLDLRGCSLLGYTAFPDIASHRARYLAAGFAHYAGWDMNDIYRHALTPASEVRRIERLELFDEFEEWHLIQAHYHVSVASVEPKALPPNDNQQQQRNGRAVCATIRWDQLGLLGKAKQPPPFATHTTAPGAVLTSTGRTVLLGGSGVRASAPLLPSAANTANPLKGSPRKPLTAPPAAPPATQD